MGDTRLRIRCETGDRARFQKISADHDPDGTYIDTLRLLMDVYEHVPHAATVVQGKDYIDPDDHIVIYPPADTAQKFRYWERHYPDAAEALRALLDLVDDSPEEVPSLNL